MQSDVVQEVPALIEALVSSRLKLIYDEDKEQKSGLMVLSDNSNKRLET